MIKDDLNLNRNDWIFLALITIFSVILTCYYIVFNENLGIYCSDIYIYLLNALYFSGTNINSIQTIYLSPVICFLTSIFFSLGFKDKLAIFIVSGIFAVLGNIGFYLLLRNRFDEILSVAGVIIYATFAINLTWLGNGTLDIPATSISIWIMLFAYMAIKINPKYYKWLITLFVIGFFTRYTVILVFPVIVLLYLYENSFSVKKEDLKEILIGLVPGIITALIIVIPVKNMGHGFLGFGGQIIGGVSGSHGSVNDLAYTTDTYYYLTNLGNFISSSKTVFINRTPSLENPTILSILIFLILIVGLILWIKNNDFKFDRQKIIGIALWIIALITFDQFSSFITILIVFLGFLLIGKDSKNQLGLIMLSWFLVYFIFCSYFMIKVNRYIIPAMPALSYLIMVGTETISEKTPKKNVLPLILIVLFLVQGFAFTYTFEDTDQFTAPEDMSNYIISNVDNWEHVKIGVYNMRPYHWYLGSNVTGIERDEPAAIENANISYYISDVPQNLTNYKEIKNIGNLYLYEKISD